MLQNYTFGLNDLLKHEWQQASVAEEGEAAVSLEGRIGLCNVAAGYREAPRKLSVPPVQQCTVAHGLTSRIIKNSFFKKRGK